MEQVPLTSRASYGEHFEVFPEVQLLGTLEPGPLEKSSRGRPSDCVYERPDYEWFHKRLMALPFLPLETIAATFDSLKPEAKTEPL